MHFAGFLQFNDQHVFAGEKEVCLVELSKDNLNVKQFNRQDMKTMTKIITNLGEQQPKIWDATEVLLKFDTVYFTCRLHHFR